MCSFPFLELKKIVLKVWMFTPETGLYHLYVYNYYLKIILRGKLVVEMTS